MLHKLLILNKKGGQMAAFFVARRNSTGHASIILPLYP